MGDMETWSHAMQRDWIDLTFVLFNYLKLLFGWWWKTGVRRDANYVYCMDMVDGRKTTSHHLGLLHVYLSRYSWLLYSAPSPSGPNLYISLSLWKIYIIITKWCCNKIDELCKVAKYCWASDFLPWPLPYRKQVVTLYEYIPKCFDNLDSN